MGEEGLLDGRCGFTTEYEWRGWQGPAPNLTCWRPTWRDHDRCIWHADVADKPADVLAAARTDGPEKLDGAVLREAVLGDAISFADCVLVGSDLTDASLARADLSGALLWWADLTDADLRDVDLTDADLRDADLTNADLRDGDLTDADLGYAALKQANLEDATLEAADLDGTDLTDARLHNCRLLDVYISDETTFGDRCAYERRADPTDHLPWTVVGPSMERVLLTDGDHHLAEQGRLTTAWHRLRYWSGRQSGHSPDADDVELLDRAISTYRNYQRLHRENSLPADVPQYFYREKEMRRLKALAEGDRLDWLSRTLQRWVAGYGERPLRVVGTSLVFVFGFGFLYSISGGIRPTPADTTPYAFDLLPSVPLSVPWWVETLAANLYFSAVTFSTLGYGDVEPASSAVQFLASVQSFLGALLMALLVAVLARRITR